MTTPNRLAERSQVAFRALNRRRPWALAVTKAADRLHIDHASRFRFVSYLKLPL